MTNSKYLLVIRTSKVKGQRSKTFHTYRNDSWDLIDLHFRNRNAAALIISDIDNVSDIGDVSNINNVSNIDNVSDIDDLGNIDDVDDIGDIGDVNDRDDIFDRDDVICFRRQSAGLFSALTAAGWRR